MLLISKFMVGSGLERCDRHENSDAKMSYEQKPALEYSGKPGSLF